MSTYLLTLNSRGRQHGPLRIHGASPAVLAQAIHRHARGWLGAHAVNVILDTDAFTGEITRRGATVATFTLRAAAEPEQPASREPLHGYTAADIDDIARHALHADRWHHAGDIDERYAAIRFAIVEHLCTTDTPPSRRDLVALGMRASDTHVEKEMHHHGWDSGDLAAGRGGMTGFQRYWMTSTIPSPETGIVDRLARAQIWPQLTHRQQRALEVMRDTGDYRLAGEALWLDANAYGNLLTAARRRFLALWHEGETPSRLWRMNKRTSALDGTCRGVPRLRASQVDAMRLRRAEGATLREIADEWQVGISTVSRYLRGEVVPVPDSVRGAA